MAPPISASEAPSRSVHTSRKSASPIPSPGTISSTISRTCSLLTPGVLTGAITVRLLSVAQPSPIPSSLRSGDAAGAMLSAVTGAFSTRGPEGRIHEAETTIGARLVVTVAEEVAVEASLPVPQDVPLSTEVPPLRDFALADPVPLYADRLIE